MKPETPSARKQREKKAKLTREGIPLDPRDFTPDDWQDLHVAIKIALEKITKRHKGKTP